MNSIMGPIFNESFAEKKRFVGPVNSVWDPLEKALLPQKRTSKKEKKKRRRRGLWVPLMCMKYVK